MEWCNSGELLAVAGQRLDGDSTPGVFTNLVHFYTSQGELRYTSRLPCRTVSSQHNTTLGVSQSTTRIPQHKVSNSVLGTTVN